MASQTVASCGVAYPNAGKLAELTNLVSIHQPNFFPWLGFFDKLARSDCFVLLDHVQLPKTGGSYVNHVKLLYGDRPRWLSVPVRRRRGLQSIAETETMDGPWRRKAVAALRTNYGRARAFDDVFGLIEPLIWNATENLADYNAFAIAALADALGIDPTKIVRSSTLPVQGEGTGLLAEIVHAVGGSTYLAGGGAEGYQDDTVFAERGINVRYQCFRHPTYQQFNSKDEFHAGLSIIDAMMNVGIAGTARLLMETDA